MKFYKNLLIILLMSISTAYSQMNSSDFDVYFVGEKLDVENDSTRFYFSIPDSAAVLINFVLSSNTDWEECDNESAILDVCADQDSLTRQSVVVYNGRKKTEYARYLWELRAGDHFVDLVFNPEKSAPGAEFVRIDSIKIAVVPPEDPYYWPCILCPYLNTFKNYSKNDIPVLNCYSEWISGSTKRYYYLIIFSHDDCHLNEYGDWSWMRLDSKASSLDGEWLYDVTIDVANDSLVFLEKYYQGKSHKTKIFSGAMRNYHPELSVATQNNNYTVGCGSGKYPQFLPPVKITPHWLGFFLPYIEKHPEIYTTWVKEMRRDHGMYNFDCKSPDAPWTFARGYNHKPEKFINTDPVYHLFFEYVLSGNSGMTFNLSLKVKNDSSWYGRNVINGNGLAWQSIVLPEETIKLENIDTLKISVSGDAGIDVGVDIDRIWYFDENVNLISHHINFPESQTLSAENPEIKYAMSDLFSDELTLHECQIFSTEEKIDFKLPFTGDLNESASATVSIKANNEESYQTFDMTRENGLFSYSVSKTLFPLIYDVMIHGIDEDGVSGYFPQYLQDVDFTALTSVENRPVKPSQFLLQNYPNPFNNSTTIQFSVPHTSFVSLEVYNSLGQLVDKLGEGLYEAGNHQITWNAMNHSCGIYFCKLKAEQRTLISKLLYLK